MLHANATIDPLDPPIWTGTWRDPRFSPPADGGRPENALSGTIFTVNDSGVEYSITVPEPFGKFRLWRNTSIATLAPGQVATLPLGTLGYEWDEALDNGSRPAGLFTLSSTTLNVPSKLQDFGSTYGAGTATHVPVVTARQVLKWVDGRNGSSIPSLSWNGSTLSFTLNIGEGANGLFVMLPTNMAAGSLSNITLNGVTVPFATGVIKGVSYAMFPAAVGNYQVAYTGP